MVWFPVGTGSESSWHSDGALLQPELPYPFQLDRLHTATTRMEAGTQTGGRCLDLPVRTDGQYRKILHELRKDKTGTEGRKGLGLPWLRRSESGEVLHGMRQSEAGRSSALQV